MTRGQYRALSYVARRGYLPQELEPWRDYMLDRRLLQRLDRGYALSDEGRRLIENGVIRERFAQVIRIEDDVRRALSNDELCVYQRAEPGIDQLGRRGQVMLDFDLDAYDAVMTTLRTRKIRFVGDARVCTGRSHRLVIADSARLLPSGDVLHHLTTIRQVRYKWGIERAFVMKSHGDDAWIAAPTERGVQLRLRNHLRMLDERPQPVVREEPYRALTHEEKLDELAYADVF